MKKILALVLIIALTFSFVACGDKSAADQVKTPEELMDKVMDASQEKTNAEFKGEFNLEVSGVEELAMMGPMSLVMEGKIKDAKNMAFNMDIDAGIGMTIQADMYMTDDNILIYAPLLGQFMGYEYMSMNLAEMQELSGTSISTTENAEEVMAILDRFQEKTEYSIYDILVMDKEMPEQEITVNEETVKTTKLSMTLSLDDAVDLIFAFMDFIANDDEAKELLLADMSQDDIDMMLEEMKDPSVREEIEAALEMLTINDFTINYYVNEDFLPVKMDMNADMTIEVDEESMGVVLTGSFEQFNFGGVESIDVPEVPEDQILDLSDMQGMY